MGAKPLILELSSDAMKYLIIRMKWQDAKMLKLDIKLQILNPNVGPNTR